MKTLYYKRNGEPYIGKDACLKWARDWKDRKNRIIKQEKLKKGIFVSTVWFGIDYSLGLANKPLIFETMVFTSKDKMESVNMQRYSTEKEALAGHKAMVKYYNAKHSRNIQTNKK